MLDRPFRAYLAPTIIVMLSIVGGLCFLNFTFRTPEGGSSAPSAEPSLVSANALTPQDLAILHNAEEILIRDCMNKHGFDYWPIPANPITMHGTFPYVIDDVEWARRNGFGHDGLIDSNEPVISPNARYLSTLSQNRRNAFSTALDGDQGGARVIVELPNSAGSIGHSGNGCTTSAETMLYGSFQTWFQASTAANYLTSFIHIKVQMDQRYIAATAQWAKCMSSNGYQYSNPDAAAAVFLSLHRDPPSKDEVRAAVAEAKCAKSVRLDAIANELDKFYRLNMPSQYRALLTEHQQLSQNALAKARDVVTRD